MSQSNYMWVPCMIENAGFSGERRFEVDLPDDGAASPAPSALCGR